MRIYKKQIKRHIKTFIDFMDLEEAIEFLERECFTWKKSELFPIPMTPIERWRKPKDYIKRMVSVFKRKLGTNAQLIINSPVQIILHGDFTEKLKKNADS